MKKTLSRLGFAVAGVAMFIPAFASAAVVYNAVPSSLPPNVASLGFQATQTSEFGDYVHLAGSDRVLRTVTVTMSDWALRADYPSLPSAGWTHPITLNIYNVVPGVPLNTKGTLIGTMTETFTIPWRPVADPTCATPTAWRASNGTCYNGLAFNITFDLTALNLTVPDDIIVGVAYNTQTYGSAPIGASGPYNSLNVGVPTGQTASVGTDDSADKVFWNTSTAGWYSDGGAGGVGIFREDTAWTPNGTVNIKVAAVGTSRGYKEAALDDLSGIIPSGDKDTDKRVGDAIEDITKSLARPNWIDDNHIDGKHADKIFEDEKHAVKSLSDIKGAVLAGVAQAIEDLLAADKLLAEIAIADMVGGDPKKLAEAGKEMDKAQSAIDKGHYDSAVEHYRNAWKKAQEA